MPASPKYIVVGKTFLHLTLRVCLGNLSKRRLVEEIGTDVSDLTLRSRTALLDLLGRHAAKLSFII
jgi:hypothetical protein